MVPCRPRKDRFWSQDNRVGSWWIMFCRSSRPSFCRTVQPSRSRSYRSLSTVATSRELREAGRINNNLVLATNPPSRSEDKPGLTIELDGVFKTCRCFSFSLPCYRFSSSSSSIQSQRDLAARDSSTSRDNNLRTVPIRELPSRPPLFEDCPSYRRRRRSGRSHRFDSPVACIYTLRHRRVTTRTR